METLIWGNNTLSSNVRNHPLSSNVFCFLLIKFTLAKSWPAHSDGSHLLHNLPCGVNLLHIRELYWKRQQGYPRRHCRRNLTAWVRSFWGTLDSRTAVSSMAQPSHTIPGCIFRHPLTLTCTFSFMTGRITGAGRSLRAPNIPAPTAALPLQGHLGCSHLNHYWNTLYWEWSMSIQER